MDRALVVLLGLAAAGAVIYFTVRYVRRARAVVAAEHEAELRTELARRLRKNGLTALDFRAVVAETQVPVGIARRTAASIYAESWSKAVADGKVTATEQKQLDLLRLRLELSDREASAIEADAKIGRYRKVALAALADGELSRNETDELSRLREQLRLTDAHVTAAVGPEARRVYRDRFTAAAADGRLTPEELADLRQLRTAFNMTLDEANGLVRDEALTLYWAWFANVVEDGEVTPEEERGLIWLRDEFGLQGAVVAAHERELADIKRIAALRRGDLPRVSTSLLLESGELCHWVGECQYQWETGNKAKHANGTLVVTSKKVAFTSPTRSFAFQPSKVLGIELYRQRLILRTSSTRGGGYYYVHDPRVLEAVLVGLVSKHNFQTSAGPGKASRHVPDHVRREVWHRDGGKCVTCAAQDYLEYDHVIPHSKGGASTVGNVQLLCRRCNGAKSDRI